MKFVVACVKFCVGRDTTAATTVERIAAKAKKAHRKGMASEKPPASKAKGVKRLSCLIQHNQWHWRCVKIRNNKLLGAPGLTTRSKDATRGSWPYY